MINLIDKCNLHDNFIFVVKYIKYINHNFFKKEVIREQKEILLYYKNYCYKNNLKLKILIDAEFEAPAYRYNLTKYCDFLIELLDIKLSDIIIFGVGEHQFDDDINFAVSHVPTLLDEMFNDSTEILLPNHHFISLARIVRPHRLYFTTKLIDKDLIKFGKLSLGSGYYFNNSENELLNFLPEKYKKFMPMVIDGTIINDDINAYVSIHPSMQSAFINIVHETAFDPSLLPTILNTYNTTEDSVGFSIWKNITNSKKLTWQVNSFTEKSMKPFVWGQVPIFNTVYDNLKYIRKLGFDLFDDIIDHSYDQIKDPIARIDAAIAQLEKICKWSIEDCQEYKKKNITRFVRNREIAQELHDHTFEKMALDSLQKALDKYKT